MSYHSLKVTIEDNIATIQINLPEKRNAMNIDSWIELDKAIKECNNNDNIRVIIITGYENVFVSGADIKWLKERKPLDIYGPAVQDVLQTVYRSSKPVIAGINGYALGGGCELALACDIRISSDQAKYGQPEINLGILPGGGGTQYLTKIVGIAKAKELILTGAIIDADEAYKLGLVNHIVPHEQLLTKVKDIAVKIAAKPPVAVKLAKIALNESVTSELSAGLALEKSLQAILFGTKDKLEGTTAFIEKRQPYFQGK